MSKNSRKRAEQHRTARPNSDLGHQIDRFFAQTDLAPGCYEHSDFHALERQAPDLLVRYALHVVTEGARRNLDKEGAIRSVAERFSEALASLRFEESIGQCVHVAGRLVRALEMLGVWCFSTKGSISVYPSDGRDPDGKHFFAVDDIDFGGGTSGHFWVVAPPFMVIDCSLYYQGWEPGLRAMMDRLVLSRTPVAEAPLFDRLTAPAHRGNPENYARFTYLQRRLWPWIKCYLVELDHVRLHYLPTEIAVLNLGRDLSFAGRPLSSFLEGL